MTSRDIVTSETMVQVRHETASRARTLSGDQCRLVRRIVIGSKVLHFIIEGEEINSKDVLDIITVNTSLLQC